MWRHHHYQAIVAAYESQAQHEQVCLSANIYLAYDVCSTNSVVFS